MNNSSVSQVLPSDLSQQENDLAPAVCSGLAFAVISFAPGRACVETVMHHSVKRLDSGLSMLSPLPPTENSYYSTHWLALYAMHSNALI